MPSGLFIRLRPSGPWRIGPDSGDRDRVDRILHSDALYSAVTSAMLRLGKLDEWLDATARAEAPAVRFSSCFPFVADTLLVVPPRNLWPPPASSKVRWKGARFVPLDLVKKLAAGETIPEDGWTIDGSSECLLPVTNPVTVGPFRVSVRSSAAVDRDGSAVSPHSTACLEFSPNSGLWAVTQFVDDAAQEQWAGPVKSAIRLLADSGFGGERSRGWGRAEAEITEGSIEMRQKETGELGYWLLSLFHPATADAIDWSQGDYALTTRGGRVESDAGWGSGKKLTRMVEEGSVLVASKEPRGSATDVAPDGFPHPVYRAGFALTVPIPLRIEKVVAQ